MASTETEFPKSHRDPLYAALDAQTEQRLGLPAGLVSSIRTNGERTDHGKVSEAGAVTPYQFIPATRDAAIKKYGIDPTLSPQNASEVAGLLLKESLVRNGGDVAQAVGEYHGGTNRDNWGPRTRAYIQRVTAAVQPQQAAGQPAQGQSTFDRVKAQMTPPDTGSIANVYAAYQAGQMTPDEAKQFEADVKDGHIMLPRGAALKGQAPQSARNAVPQAVLDAYKAGQMSKEEADQFEQDVRSGLATLPPGQVMSSADLIPGAMPTPPRAPEQQRSLGEKVQGAIEAGLNTVSALTGGTAGMAGGMVKQMAKEAINGDFGSKQAADRIEQAAMQGADALTYQPRTQAGQEYSQAIGDAMSQALPVMPMTAEMAALARGSQPAARMAGDAARATQRVARDSASQVAKSAQEGAQAVARPVREFFGAEVPEAQRAPTEGTGQSIGAAGTDMATMRREAARNLPEPIELTRGQAERSFEQQRFEQEAAKDPSAGAPLRDRMADQTAKVHQNFDHFFDMTEAQATSPYEAGVMVDKALRDKAAREKVEVRAKYKAAEKAGAMEDPVELGGLIQHINDQVPEAETSPILNVARKKALSLGAAVEDSNGNLVAQPVQLRITETLRRSIGQATDAAPTNMRQSAIMKGLIDEATDGLGGDLYKQARAARARYAQQYENVSAIADLLNNKRGMADRKVAFEDVFRRSILNGSLDDMRTVRKVLQTGGEQGKQAWKELQGQTVQYIRDEATRGVQTDSRGNPIISAAGLHKAVTTLDKKGGPGGLSKLDFIFGKRGAQQIRDINDLAKVIYTAPPGAVNTSNTASVILAALTESAISGGLTGLPVPVMTGLKAVSMHVKDRRLRARIADALGKAKDKDEPGNGGAPAQAAPARTLH